MKPSYQAFDLNPTNKIKYNYGDKVRFKISSSENIYSGTIVGFISEHLIDFWAVELDEFLPNWPYKVISVANTAILREEQ